MSDHTMKRLTSSNPDDNFGTMLNLFFCKDGTTWMRGGGPAPEYPDIKLDDWIRGIIKKFCPEEAPYYEQINDDHLNMIMAEITLGGGLDTSEDLVALLYNTAWAFSELNARLMEYEGTGLSPQEVSVMKFRLEGLEK